METREKADGEREFRAGLRELARHRPDLAMKSLRLAVAACPARASGLLSSRLYWLSVALLRLDRPELAAKSLASAQKLRPRGHARDAYAHRVNCYGMPRRASAELDDFYAFYSIHVSRYLGRGSARRFSDQGECDAVTRLVALAWRELKGSGRLRDLEPGAKLELFRGWKFDFPSYRGDPSSRAGSCPDPVIHVDFRRGRVTAADERCSCGSGLPWRRCCGRTSSPCEIHPGH